MSQTVQDLPVRILSFNCAKSSLSVETILEHFVLAYDIVFIQEPPWRFVRTAPSTSRKSGDDVIGAPLHPSWLPMVPYDIVFIQEHPWRFVRTALSTSRKSGDDVIGAPLHPSWLPMARIPEPNSRPRVMAYVSNRLKEFRPSMRRDLIDHRDVLILSLFANGQCYNLMNVYSDDTHMAALLLAEEAASLPPFIYMGGFRSTVIDLVFVQPDQTLTAQVTRVHNAQGESDHIPLATTLSISADSGATPRRALKADREEQICFVR
ncbi:hypothetical protein CVT25_001005, partial [Psilocybe cyanescens]